MDEVRLANKKKKKSYQAITRRFRPKSDAMAIADTNVRKQIIEVDKRLKPPKGFQQHALAQRCIAAVFPLRKTAGTTAATAAAFASAAGATANGTFQFSLPNDAIVLNGGAATAPQFASAPTAYSAKDPPPPPPPKTVPPVKSFFEERVRLELKFMGLLPPSKAKSVDVAKAENRVDDEVATHLRRLQAQLKAVNASNVKRCERIQQRAADMAAALPVYEDLREAERVLEDMYQAKNSASWDESAALEAINAYEKARRAYLVHADTFGNAGTLFATPEQFAGIPRNRSQPV